MVPVHQPIIVNFFFQVFTRCQGTLFMSSSQYSATVQYVAAYQATYLSQPVIDQVGTNLYSLVNRELLGVSSLSMAISQKPSRRALNHQPSDPESETLTARPWTHLAILEAAVTFMKSGSPFAICILVSGIATQKKWGSINFSLLVSSKKSQYTLIVHPPLYR